MKDYKITYVDSESGRLFEHCMTGTEAEVEIYAHSLIEQGYDYIKVYEKGWSQTS